MNERVRKLLEHRQSAKVIGVACIVVLGLGLASLGPVGKKTPAHPQGFTGGDTGGSSSPAIDTPASGAPLTVKTSSNPATSAPAGYVRIATSTGGYKIVKKVSASQIPDFGLITQGVTDKQVTIGFSYNEASCGDAAVLQAQYDNQAGDPKKAIDTYTQYINDTGGIGGRKLVSVISDDGGSGCPEKNTSAAIDMLEKQKVFMAAPGLHVESDYLIARHLPVFGGRDDPKSLAKYGANGLMLFEPEEPSHEAWASFGKYYLDTPHHVPCLIRIASGAAGDFDTEQKILDEKFAKYGMKFKDQLVFQDDVSTAQQQSTDIVRKAKADGCDQVWFMAGNAVGLIFMTDAATQQQWFPTWTFTSRTYLADYDVGGGLMDQVQWQKAVGLSVRVPAGEHPKAGNCQAIYDKYNGKDAQDTSAATQGYCAQILTMAEMMRRAVAVTGTLNANTLMLGASAIQDDFFFDAFVPMDYDVRNPAGPWKTRGFSFYTVVKWNATQGKYTFPEYPCYYRTFKPNNGGCESLTAYFKKAK